MGGRGESESQTDVVQLRTDESSQGSQTELSYTEDQEVISNQEIQEFQEFQEIQETKEIQERKLSITISTFNVAAKYLL